MVGNILFFSFLCAIFLVAGVKTQEPYDFQVISINPVQASLNWNPFAGEAYYSIYDREQIIAVSSGNIVSDSPAYYTTYTLPNTAYRFQVGYGEQSTNSLNYTGEAVPLNSSVPMVTLLDATTAYIVWDPFSVGVGATLQALVQDEWVILRGMVGNSPTHVYYTGLVLLDEGDQLYCRIVQGDQITSPFLISALPREDLSPVSFSAYEEVITPVSSYTSFPSESEEPVLVNHNHSLALHFELDPNGIAGSCTVVAANLRITPSSRSVPGGGFVRVHSALNEEMNEPLVAGTWISNAWAQVVPFPSYTGQAKYDVPLDRQLYPAYSLETSLREWRHQPNGTLLIQFDGGSKEKLIFDDPLADVELITYYAKQIPASLSTVSLTETGFTSPTCPDMLCAGDEAWVNAVWSFTDPLPADGLLIQVMVTIQGSWSAGGRISLSLENGAVGMVPILTSSPECTTSIEDIEVESPLYRVDAGGFPGYQYQGVNQLFLLVEGGSRFCVEEISLEFRYVDTLLSCEPNPSATPTPSRTPSMTPTPSITASPSASITPSSSSSRTPSQSPSPSSSSSRSASATSSLSMGASPTSSPSMSMSSSRTPSSSASSSRTPSSSASPSISRSSTRSPSATSSITPTPSVSGTSSTSLSRSPSRSVSHTSSRSVSLTRSRTPSSSLLPSQTGTPTPTPSVVSSVSRSPTPTRSLTASVSRIVSSASSSSTLSPSASVSPSPSTNPSPSSSPSRSASPSRTASLTTSPSQTPSRSPIFVLPPLPSPSSTPSRNPSISLVTTPTPSPSRLVSPSASASLAPVITSGADPVIIRDEDDEPVVIVSPSSPSEDTLEVIPINRDEAVTPTRLTSSVVSLILRNAAGEEIQPASTVEICLSADSQESGEGSCLGYLDEEAKGGPRWRCQDRCLRKKKNLFCGETDHFTNFALLLNGGASGCGDSSYYIFRESWKDAVLLSSFGGAAIVCIIFFVVLSFTPCGSRFVRGSEGDRISRLRGRDRSVVNVEQHV